MNTGSRLHRFLFSLEVPQRQAFARAVRTAKGRVSLGHLYNISYGYKLANPELAINIEREARALGGHVPVESICPGVDWNYIRGTKKRRGK